MARARLVRAATAAAGTALALALTTAVPAVADDAVTGNVHPTGGPEGVKVKIDGKGELFTRLIPLTLDDKGKTKLHTYCVEIDTRVSETHTAMREVGWDKYPVAESPFHKNRGKINWVLQNSYPTVKLDALAKKAGLADGALAENEAIGATQAAVWSFSDNGKINEADPTPKNKDSKDDVLAVYKYLTTNAKELSEPTPALELKPKSLTGTAGKKIGPFKLATTAEKLELTAKLPEGVKLVDAKGKELKGEGLKNEAEIYVDVPAGTAAGDITIELKGQGSLHLGRLFIGKKYHENPTQSLIVAKSETSELSAKATAKWAAAGGPSTTPSVPVKIPAGDGEQIAAAANQGPGALPFALGGGAVLLLGAGAVVLVRRRNLAPVKDDSQS
ncbi:thioester domain-containing protein [Amycolatopsis suaedae]|nr:thioester domain-containing protein [Amycolatopsis suaedae]